MSRVPPHASGGKSLPDSSQLEQLDELEELGDDAIIAHQQGAHVPKPRAQVTEESRSVVISDHPPVGSNPPQSPSAPPVPSSSPPPGGPGARRRSERTEKTVVIRDRRQIDELRREMAKRKPQGSATAALPGLWVWVVVGVAAFLTGGLVALFATREDDEPVAPIPSISPPSLPASGAVAPVDEPPSVSIDELPVEGSKK